MRTIVDVRDAVGAYFILLINNPVPGEIYNIMETFHTFEKFRFNFIQQIKILNMR